MPFLGLGIHVILALLCAIHAVRTRQEMYWLFILFMFPLLGSLVYLFAIYLPHSRLERGALQAVSAAVKAVDPNREVREARARFTEAPTAQNRMRLAEALLEQGNATEAADQYQQCLTGPFASDLEIRFGAAHAMTECQRYEEAIQHLEEIRAEEPKFRAEAVSILLARCYAGTSRAAKARDEFDSALKKFGSFGAKAEYAIWLYSQGDLEPADKLFGDLEAIQKRWNSASRRLNEPVAHRLRAARELAKRQGG